MIGRFAGVRGGGARRATRGGGLLEDFLARQRARRADGLIGAEAREGRVLDIGCGSYPVFLEGTVFAEKVGLDPAAAEVRGEMAERGITMVTQELGGGELPWADESFEVVTMLAVFEHLAPGCLAGVLGEIHRVLRPGGRFIMTTPTVWGGRVLQVMVRLGLVSRAEIEEHRAPMKVGEIRELLVGAGFARERMGGGCFELGMNRYVWADKQGG